MFAKVFGTAKRILRSSPSYQGESEETTQAIPRSAQPDAEDDEMVTTRRGTGTDVESTPASSVRTTRGKRHLEIDVQESPAASKRQRRAASKKDTAAEEDGEKTQMSVEADQADEPSSAAKVLPSRTRSKKTFEVAEARTPVARRSSPKILIPGPSSRDSADEAPNSAASASSHADVFYTPAQHAFALPAEDDDEREGSITPRPVVKSVKATPATGKGSGKRGRPRKNPAPPSPEKTPTKSRFQDEIPSSTQDTEQAPLSPAKPDDDAETPTADGNEANVESRGQVQEDATNEEPAVKSKPTKKQVKDLASAGIAFEDVAPDTSITPPRQHKHFDDEEPAEIPEPTVQVAPEQELDEDDGSDSDEAPEMVTTSAAASKAKAAAQETTRARDALQAREEQRRKERADRIAQEQAEKREREEKKARKLARKEAKLARRQQRETSTPPRDPMDVDTSVIPDLLPASILEAAGDHRPPTPPLVRVGRTEEELRREKLNRHIKFLERGEAPIKDLKKGKLNVSVLSQRNALLAPKVNRDTKNIREHWLKGREAERKGRGGRKGGNFKKMERRTAPKGFLRNGDDD